MLVKHIMHNMECCIKGSAITCQMDMCIRESTQTNVIIFKEALYEVGNQNCEMSSRARRQA